MKWVPVKRKEMQAVVALYKQGFGRKLIARQLGISERHVRTVITRARLKPRKRGHGWMPADDYRKKILVGFRMLPLGVAPRNAILGVYINAAKKKGVTWALTEPEFDTLIVGDCVYCGSSASMGSVYSFAHRGHPENKLAYNGIDRRDSMKGYTTENSVSCCKICNRAKSSLSLQDFEQWVSRLVSFRTRMRAA